MLGSQSWGGHLVMSPICPSRLPSVQRSRITAIFFFTQTTDVPSSPSILELTFLPEGLGWCHCSCRGVSCFLYRDEPSDCRVGAHHRAGRRTLTLLTLATSWPPLQLDACYTVERALLMAVPAKKPSSAIELHLGVVDGFCMPSFDW